MGITHKNITFFWTLWSHNINNFALFEALLQTQMTDFPTLLYSSTSEIPTLSYT